MALEDKVPNPIDLHVGNQVRLRRKFLGLSQGDLAKPIGLTFQQLQKYERGANRISASKLYEIASILKTPIASFFEGYTEGAPAEEFNESVSERSVHGFLKTIEGVELAEAFPRIKSGKHRRKILELVRTLSVEGD